MAMSMAESTLSVYILDDETCLNLNYSWDRVTKTNKINILTIPHHPHKYV